VFVIKLITAIGLLWMLFALPSIAEPCPTNSSGGDVRDLRDCYPWPQANQSVCEDRGCVWCPSDISDVPPCLYNDDVCPSRISESSRVDCLPEGGVRQNCLQKRCIWCESATQGK
jgi:Trefoil (P-type) domain